MKKVLHVKLVFVLAVAATLIAQVANAELAGTLSRLSPYQLEVNAAPGDVAVTIFYLKGPRLDSVTSLTNPRGEEVIPPRTDRIIFFVDPEKGSAGTFKISQNGVPIAEEGYSDTSRYVLEVQ